ncbi:hypothetical protein [Mycoplasma sp. OR1901]|uniref:hypothetical protein n=1 Tax=Mycoplasma sp. OR1901 TaxID=2742195 RepID=UPI001581497A|nr:hypothetical protein [Mycoplasma sp. OR1901]QKT05332.1 hypothetical protein HTZ87_01290 [Mycoplasma sp. OR1901]
MKSLYIQYSSKRNQKITNEISRSMYENETNLTRLKLLSKNNKTYEKIYSELDGYYNTLKKYSDVIKTNLENSNNWIQLRKTKELLKINRILKKNFKNFKNNQSKVKGVTHDFQKLYEEVDESISRIIQVCEYLLKRLEAFECSDYKTVRYITKEVHRLKRETKAILDKKTNANMRDLFADASEKEKNLLELFKLENNHLTIEYFLFGPIMNSLKDQHNLLNKEQNTLIDKYLKEIKNAWLAKSFKVDLLISKIRDFYYYLNNIFMDSKSKIIIDEFKNKNYELIHNFIIKLIDKNGDDIKKLNPELKAKTVNELKFYSEKLQAFSKNNDYINYYSNLDDLINMYKDLEKNIYLTLSESKREGFSNIKEEFNNIENLYYIVMQHKFLPKNDDTLKITDNLEVLYKNIQSDSSKNDINEWVLNIEQLIRIIGENIEYKQMYDKINEYVINNKKYNDKIQLFKSFLFSAENNIKNRDYKAAYKIMKKFIITQ